MPATSRGGGSRRDPLPPLTIVWTGPLGGIGRAEPRLSVDTLERELSIRKMERDAERLEELRREDEERGRIEAERQRRLENPERGAAPATPTAAPVIEVPLPIPPSMAPSSGSVPPAIDEPSSAPRIVRPPSSTRPSRAELKSLQDLLMGHQP